MKKFAIITAGVACFVGLHLFKLMQGIKNYEDHAALLQFDLGFNHESPYVRIEGDVREVFTMASIVPGGIFDRSGVRRGDIIMDVQILPFYKHLETYRGGNYTFSVVEGGDGPKLGKRTKRAITVTIPPKR